MIYFSFFLLAAVAIIATILLYKQEDKCQEKINQIIHDKDLTNQQKLYKCSFAKLCVDDGLIQVYFDRKIIIREYDYTDETYDKQLDYAKKLVKMLNGNR